MDTKELSISYHPKDTVKTSVDAIAWDDFDPGNTAVRYAVTSKGKYFRKPRHCRDYRDWKAVTKAHVQAAARERWWKAKPK